jgi:hypothetical protein
MVSPPIVEAPFACRHVGSERPLEERRVKSIHAPEDKL